jgi:hypothetical protein
MKKIIRLTESDLARIVKRVIKEQTESPMEKFMEDCLNKKYYPKYILGSSSTEQKFVMWGEDTDKNWELTVYFNEEISKIALLFSTSDQMAFDIVKNKFTKAVSNKTGSNGNNVTTSRVYNSTNEKVVTDMFKTFVNDILRLCVT